MRKWKLRWFSVVLAAVLMASVVPNSLRVYAAEEGGLTQYCFLYIQNPNSTNLMRENQQWRDYRVCNYAYNLGNGWFFAFNIGWLFPSENMEGDGLVDTIRQSIEKKVVPDELLEARGAYGSGPYAHPGMHDPEQFPPVFWYRGKTVPPEEMKDTALSAQSLNKIGYPVIEADGSNVFLEEKARVEEAYGAIWPNGIEYSGEVRTYETVVTVPQGAAAHCVAYSNEADLRTVNGSLNPTYSYDEYVEAFGEEPPLPPGWEYEKEDKKELAALLKDIGVNYYPYSRSFTEESWKPLETAFYDGIDVYNNANATGEDIAEAVYNIKYYRTLLQLKPGEKSLDQQRREKALKDFWDMMTKAIDNFRKVKDAAEYVPDDRVGDWVDKANTVTDKFDKAETVVKGGYDAYEWFDALNRASKTQTNGQVNEGIYDIIRKTNEIIMTPFGKGAQDFTGEGGVTVAKGISGKAHTSKVATETYTDAGQFDEAIQSMVPPSLRQNGGR